MTLVYRSYIKVKKMSRKQRHLGFQVFYRVLRFFSIGPRLLKGAET